MIGIGIDIGATGPQAGSGNFAPRPILLIVAGQSNAGKSGTAGLTPPAKYQALDLKIWDNVGGFVDYAVGANPGDYPTSWGTEAEFTHLLQQSGSARPVFMVKRSQGGTPVNPEAGQDWHPGSGELFGELEARVGAARSAIIAAEGTPPEEITFWNQGERDIQDNLRAASYAANFATFLAEYRGRISSGLFIVERTRPFPGWFANGFTVRKAQLDVVAGDGGAAALDCDFPVAAGFGVLHPGPDWCEGIGARAHAVWSGTYAAIWGDILDAVPDPAVFADLAGQTPGATVVSDVVTPQGFERDCAVDVAGGEYRILHPDDTLAADWTAAQGLINKWQKIQLRQTASASSETATAVTLTLGGAAVSDWTVTTAVADTVPGAFDFVDLAGQPRGTLVVSDIVVPAGYTAPAPVVISGPGAEYRVLDAADTEILAWTAAAGSLAPGQKVQLRLTTATGFETATTASLDVGGVVADWQVVTEADMSAATLDYLVVAGGGPGGKGGGGSGGGGGGAGGVLTGTTAASVAAFPVIVGAGGVNDGLSPTSSGGDSSVLGQTAVGGGAGADSLGTGDWPGAPGGSGGGGGGFVSPDFIAPGGAGTQGQGMDGGAGNGSSAGSSGSLQAQRTGGGGGGATVAGEPGGTDHAGAGGEGRLSSITGTAVVYGSGSGGAQRNAGGKYAGLAPGGTNAGTGGNLNAAPTAPAAHTGSGGGGSTRSGATPTGGAAGVVVIAYATGSLSATGGTVTTAGGMTIHRFTASGVFEVTAPS